MSLFPNWTIQLHHNLMAPYFDKVDNIIDGLQLAPES
jgi:hypothetical protein